MRQVPKGLKVGGRDLRPDLLLEEPEKESGKRAAGTGDGKTLERSGLGTPEMLRTLASHLLFLYTRNKQLALRVPLAPR